MKQISHKENREIMYKIFVGVAIIFILLGIFALMQDIIEIMPYFLKGILLYLMGFILIGIAYEK